MNGRLCVGLVYALTSVLDAPHRVSIHTIAHNAAYFDLTASARSADRPRSLLLERAQSRRQIRRPQAGAIHATDSRWAGIAGARKLMAVAQKYLFHEACLLQCVWNDAGPWHDIFHPNSDVWPASTNGQDYMHSLSRTDEDGLSACATGHPTQFGRGASLKASEAAESNWKAGRGRRFVPQGCGRLGSDRPRYLEFVRSLSNSVCEPSISVQRAAEELIRDPLACGNFLRMPATIQSQDFDHRVACMSRSAICA
ncbi:hypothetical protein V8E36_004981 [Tilletia maclaganii]